MRARPRTTVARSVTPLRLIAVAIVLAGLYVMEMASARHSSPVFDEVAYITGGYSYWTLDDYRLNPENGNWPQRWVALPLLGRFNFPQLDHPSWQIAHVWMLGDLFLYWEGNDTDRMMLLARGMTVLVTVALGALVCFWSWRLFGAAGGWVTLLLFVFSPSILAHGAVATSDMMAAAFFTASAWTLWVVLHHVTPRTLAVSTLAASALFLSKFSAPILVFVAVGMLIVRLLSSKPVTLSWRGQSVELQGRLKRLTAHAAVALAHVLVGFLLIWASYGFRYDGLAAHVEGEQPQFQVQWSQLLANPTVTNQGLQWAREHHVLPEAYLYGLSYVMAFSGQRAAFLNGQYSMTGWRWFFPYAALVKTTPGALLLLLTALLTVAWLGFKSSREPPPEAVRDGPTEGWCGLYELTPLVILIGVYWVFAVVSNLNIGERHLLPTYPATMVLMGAAGYWPMRWWRERKEGEPRAGNQRYARSFRLATTSGGLSVLVVAFLGWHATESLRIAPQYLAYFNFVAGGPRNAYRHLVDSSLDWGQSLPALKDWLDRQGLQGPGHPPVYLSYFGTGRSEYYGIDATLLPGFFDRRPAHVPEPLMPGVYCISATLLQGVYLTSGPWTDREETSYQIARAAWKTFSQADQSTREALLKEKGEEFWIRVQSFDRLRMGRLVAYLERREPDDNVGYSILIYSLGDDDLRKALEEPLF